MDAVMLVKIAALLAVGSLGIISLYNFIWGSMKNGQSASLLCGTLTTVLTFTSPVFYTVDNMPKALKPLASVNPMTYIVGFLRHVTLETYSYPSPLVAGVGLLVLITLNIISMRRAMANL
jgi:ABC-type polysaccharide/polyol phosphate export permease